MEQKAKDAAWKVRFLRDSLCCFTMAVGYDETSPDSGFLTNTPRKWRFFFGRFPSLKLTQHLKTDGWKTTFLLGPGLFSGAMLDSGSVIVMTLFEMDP